MWFSAKCFERISLRDLSQYLNTAIKYSLLLPLAIEQCKNSITLVFNSSLASSKNKEYLIAVFKH